MIYRFHSHTSDIVQPIRQLQRFHDYIYDAPSKFGRNFCMTKHVEVNAIDSIEMYEPQEAK